MKEFPKKYATAREARYIEPRRIDNFASVRRAAGKRKRKRERNIMVKAKTELMVRELQSATERDVILANLANKIWSSRRHKHLATACNITFVPNGNPAVPEVMLCGAAGVGKTTLLRALFKNPFPVATSTSTIRRDGMNFFSVGGVLNICETPGFGDARTPWYTVLQHASLIRNFVRCRPSLKMVYYCMPAGDISGDGLRYRDIDALKFLGEEVPMHTIVLTKCDLESRNLSPAAVTMRGTFHKPGMGSVFEELHYSGISHPVIATSALSMGGVDALRYDIVMNAFASLPTDRLTMTEVRRLGERLLSQSEIATIRPLHLPPTLRDEMQREWDSALHLDEDVVQSSALHTLPNNEEKNDSNVSKVRTTTTVGENGNEDFHLPVSALPNSLMIGVEQGHRPSSTSSVLDAAASRQPLLTHTHQSCQVLQHAAQLEQQKHTENFRSLLRKMSNVKLRQFVAATSPWRDPTLYPPTVIPTRSKRANIMRCPDDPFNPYLTQPRFVAGRADMVFRRPNVPVRSRSKRPWSKGCYLPDKPIHMLAAKRYTIPFFPDIVDVRMFPKPWAFFTSPRKYWQTVGSIGMLLGIRYTRYATNGIINAISDNPVPRHLPLAQELRKLEAVKYGAPLGSGKAKPPSQIVSVAGTSSRELRP